MTKQQLYPLTGLRGVAACSVMLGHAIATAYAYDLKTFYPYSAPFAHFGMSLFFVLSGFVIQYNYAAIFHHERLHAASWRFFVARFARLYPLYAITILYALPSIPTPFPAWLNLSYLTLTQSWFNAAVAIFPPDWSISAEWFFYFAFVPLTMLVSKIQRPLMLFSLFCVMAIVSLSVAFNLWRTEITQFSEFWFYHGARISSDPWQYMNYFLPALRLLDFVCGTLMARALQVGSISKSMRLGILLRLALAWCGVAALVDALDVPVLRVLTQNFAFAPGIAIAMLCLCQRDGALARVLSSPPMLFLGTISYSIYVWSFTVMAALGGMLASARPITVAYLNSALKVPAICALTIVFAYGSYTMIEVPSRRRIRQWLSPAKDV